MLHPAGAPVSRETIYAVAEPSRFPPQIRRQNPQRCRRQAVEPAGLPDRARPRRFELAAGLVGEPGTSA